MSTGGGTSRCCRGRTLETEVISLKTEGESYAINRDLCYCDFVNRRRPANRASKTDLHAATTIQGIWRKSHAARSKGARTGHGKKWLCLFFTVNGLPEIPIPQDRKRPACSIKSAARSNEASHGPPRIHRRRRRHHCDCFGAAGLRSHGRRVPRSRCPWRRIDGERPCARS